MRNLCFEMFKAVAIPEKQGLQLGRNIRVGLDRLLLQEGVSPLANSLLLGPDKKLN